MTEFEKWCEENGFDPEGEFELLSPIRGSDAVKIGDFFTLANDDNTSTPYFRCKRNSIRVAIGLHRLIQRKPRPQFDPHTFDFRQVLPKCWVRDREADEWREAWFLEITDCPYPFRVAGNSGSSYFFYCTFEDPTIEQRKTELKSRAEELRAELARIEKELGE